MFDTDYEKFAAMLDAVYDLLGKTPQAKIISPAAKAMFFRAVAHHSLADVQAALDHHGSKGTFTPIPNDVHAFIEARRPIRWITADEAWARMPKSEADSAMLTNESAEAMAAATPLLEQGDKVAARMAFKAAYDRLVEAANVAGRAPSYFASFGTEKSQQGTMLANAVQAGQIELQAAIDLKPEYGHDIVAMVGVKIHPLLAPPSAEGKARIAELRQLLQVGAS